MKLSSIVMIILVAVSCHAVAASENQTLIDQPDAQKRGGQHVTADGTPARKAELSQRVAFDPRTLAAFVNSAQLTLETTKQKVPGYGKLMAQLFTKKKWYYTESKLNCPYFGSQEIGALPAICQSEFEVLVYWPYFNPDSPKTNLSLEHQGNSLVHEMNRYVAMLKNLSDNALVNIDDTIEQNIPEQNLAFALQEYGFGQFATGSEINSTREYLQRIDQTLYPMICGKNDLVNAKHIEAFLNDIIEQMEKTKKPELVALLNESRISVGNILRFVIQDAISISENGVRHYNLGPVCEGLFRKINSK